MDQVRFSLVPRIHGFFPAGAGELVGKEEGVIAVFGGVSEDYEPTALAFAVSLGISSTLP
jgi:hypothetical protein